MPRTPASPPPRTTLCPAIPRWQELTPELRANLLIQLTRLLYSHVGHAAPCGTEVDDDKP
jgi:hypothetical protein